MKKIKFNNKNFYKDLAILLNKRSQENLYKIDKDVKNIINEVKDKGDEALFRYAKEFDKSIINRKNILLSKKNILDYKNKVDLKVLDSFKIAINNIKKFHKKQVPKNYEITNKGVTTSLIWKPIESVGLYIPGGNAVYPSSLIMNVLPAKVAGVKRIVVVTPSKSNIINPYILALLDILKIHEVYQIGGAHSIAALAYGSKSINSVNKIFGPGNSYVASAKKQVFGKVGIDLIAGPSEIVVVANRQNNPKWVASDLIAQAEHDEKAQSILITDNEEFAQKVTYYIKDLLSKLTNNKVAKKSLRDFGLIIINKNLEEAANIINFIAPEHLHLQNKNYIKILNKITNVGGIFIGKYTTEAFGDYVVVTNHVLPTSGSAKFSSGLGVLDFMKRISIVKMNKFGYDNNKDYVSKMSEVESLEGHNLSVKVRQTEKK